jgi:hypothetical protein
LLFCPLWIGRLLPLMHSGQKPDALYSIFILDLCFVMPAFVIVAVLTAQNKGLGLLLTPVLFVKGFTLLFSVALGSLFKPLYHGRNRLIPQRRVGIFGTGDWVFSETTISGRNERMAE